MGILTGLSEFLSIRYRKMGYCADLERQGASYAHAPWDVAKELWYWRNHEEKVDIPIPDEFAIYHKEDPINFHLD